MPWKGKHKPPAELVVLTFVIMVKGMSESVRRMILENKGEFENIRKYNIRKYKTFRKTIKKKLYISDEKERYFHIYYSDQKACVEHEQIEAKIDRMTKYLNSLKGEKATVGDGYKKYFKLEIHKFEEAGYTMPTKWDELIALAEEIKAKGEIPFVLPNKDSWVVSNLWTNIEARDLGSHEDEYEKMKAGEESFETIPEYKSSVEKMIQLLD